MEKSTAERVLSSPDPIGEARKLGDFKGRPFENVLRFHFDDGSCLDFSISYTALQAGRTLEAARP